MIFFGLRAESGYDVCCEAAIRHDLANLPDSVEVPLAGIFPTHLLKHPGASGLDGKVDMAADVLMSGHRIDDFVADVLRVGCGEANS